MNSLKIRCSAIGYIMTNPRSKKDREAGELSQTCKSYLAQLETEMRTGRIRDIYTKAMEKGVEMEDAAIELLNRVTGEFYLKNEESFENEYLTGTPDIVQGIVRDIKCSYDLFTFPHAWNYTLDKGYYWQLQGYMDLTGLEKASLDYCLVDTPSWIIEREKNRYAWMEPEQFDVISEQIERLHTYSDLPDSERVFSIEVERNDEDIKAIHERVEQCREFWAEKIGEIKAA